MSHITFSRFTCLSGWALLSAFTASGIVSVLGLALAAAGRPADTVIGACAFTPLVVPSLLVYGLTAIFTPRTALRLASFAVAYLPLALMGLFNLWIAVTGRSTDAGVVYVIALATLVGHTVCHAAAFASLLIAEQMAAQGASPR